MRARSKKREADQLKRLAVRHIVLMRDRSCQAEHVIPEIECGWLPNRYCLEVDELRGGSYRCTEWLDPDRCHALCPVHHDWKTANKREFLRRRGVQ